ncbi:MAG TPA: class I SAM-dependent methyltransferase [Mariprofundaceae bacterium]|nr:class I SAM-dependent methyltransferase [Mariprofundaceae bacterium]
MARLSITAEIHHFLSSKIKEGDRVIDATLGNGHDTLFLAKAIGDSGHLFGFDIQSTAIENTNQLLMGHGIEERTTLMQASHARMAERIPEPFHGQIRAIMFNLGYLPGTDKSVTTAIDSTIAALEQSCSLLTKHGLISLLAYTGHAGGMDEYMAVKTWAERLNENEYRVSIQNLLPDHQQPPRWILIERLSAPL